MDKPRVNIWTDGACSGNPGPGGWGAVLINGQKRTELCGGAADTTNNRMELTGAIKALNALPQPSMVRIHTDSTYVKDGLTKWLAAWKRNGWKTAAKKNVKNRELWQMLEAACVHHDVEWVWVKGHSGDKGNEAADALARMGVLRARSNQEHQ